MINLSSNTVSPKKKKKDPYGMAKGKTQFFLAF
jgi:hypothetical protein